MEAAARPEASTGGGAVAGATGGGAGVATVAEGGGVTGGGVTGGTVACVAGGTLGACRLFQAMKPATPTATRAKTIATQGRTLGPGAGRSRAGTRDEGAGTGRPV